MKILNVSSTLPRNGIDPLEDLSQAGKNLATQQDPYDLGVEILHPRLSNSDQVPSHPFASCDGSCESCNSCYSCSCGCSGGCSN